MPNHKTINCSITDMNFDDMKVHTNTNLLPVKLIYLCEVWSDIFSAVRKLNKSSRRGVGASKTDVVKNVPSRGYPTLILPAPAKPTNYIAYDFHCIVML